MAVWGGRDSATDLHSFKLLLKTKTKNPPTSGFATDPPPSKSTIMSITLLYPFLYPYTDLHCYRRLIEGVREWGNT